MVLLEMHLSDISTVWITAESVDHYSGRSRPRLSLVLIIIALNVDFQRPPLTTGALKELPPRRVWTSMSIDSRQADGAFPLLVHVECLTDVIPQLT